MPTNGAGSTRALASRRGRRNSTHVVLSRREGGDWVQPPLQLPAGVAGCPGPDSVQWKWRSRVLLSLHDPVGVYEHYGSTEESR